LGATAINTEGFAQLIHPLPRLQLMAVLVDVTDAEFATLRQLLDISDSQLSKHLALLSEAKLIKISKAKANGRQRTWVEATILGRETFERHIQSLRQLSGER
jgi:DNA-binding MarR family transcriptional regulator